MLPKYRQFPGHQRAAVRVLQQGLECVRPIPPCGARQTVCQTVCLPAPRQLPSSANQLDRSSTSQQLAQLAQPRTAMPGSYLTTGPQPYGNTNIRAQRSNAKRSQRSYGAFQTRPRLGAGPWRLTPQQRRVQIHTGIESCYTSSSTLFIIASFSPSTRKLSTWHSMTIPLVGCTNAPWSCGSVMKPKAFNVFERNSYQRRGDCLRLYNAFFNLHTLL